VFIISFLISASILYLYFISTTTQPNTLRLRQDDLIHFRQLRSMAVQGGDVDLDDGSDLVRATAEADGIEVGLEITNKSNTPIYDSS
jgi:hypothetical protein